MALAAGGCTPAAETTQITSAFLSPLPTSTLQPDVGVITPTQTLEDLLPTPGEDFCSDERVQAALHGLIDAIQERDGAALSLLVDPSAGLDIYFTAANPPVNIQPQVIEGLFNSTESYNWGIQPGSGMPKVGAFNTDILPALLDVMEREYSQACQTLELNVGTGPTTALVTWPEKFDGTPYIALYRQPGPQDYELDWRTWVVGFSIVNGQPKIRVLVQYFWEI